MKIILTWFTIIELKKTDAYNFGKTWIPIPMLELPILNKRQYQYLFPMYRKVYLGTYRKWTKKL